MGRKKNRMNLHDDAVDDTTATGAEDVGAHFFLGTVNKTAMVRKQVNVNRTPVAFKIDSGADVNTIPVSEYQRLQPRPTMRHVTV